mmetsp:Transcript_21577/g.43272  ORF Transcript_21577/g.43272 Transcript_21577/m.43272 type:complete len:210 (-) Transcript_21577:32-661(-)
MPIVSTVLSRSRGISVTFATTKAPLWNVRVPPPLPDDAPATAPATKVTPPAVRSTTSATVSPSSDRRGSETDDAGRHREGACTRTLPTDGEAASAVAHRAPTLTTELLNFGRKRRHAHLRHTRGRAAGPRRHRKSIRQKEDGDESTRRWRSVVVGGGATGVERSVARADFWVLDVRRPGREEVAHRLHIVRVEALPRILGPVDCHNILK